MTAGTRRRGAIEVIKSICADPARKAASEGRDSIFGCFLGCLSFDLVRCDFEEVMIAVRDRADRREGREVEGKDNVNQRLKALYIESQQE
jgi:hypothetical protein